MFKPLKFGFRECSNQFKIMPSLVSKSHVYEGAGTIEFTYDSSRKAKDWLSFMEVNFHLPIKYK